MSGPAQQLGRVEDHPEVRSQGMLADVVGTDGGAHRAVRTITAEDVDGGDHRPVPALVGHGDAHRVIVLLEPGHPPAGGQRHRRGLAGDIAQQLLQHILGSLLTGLGRPSVLRRQSEDAAEARQLVSDQRRAEDDVLRPRDGQRRTLAQAIGDTPTPQVLHRADADRLAARPGVRHRGSRLDHHTLDPAPSELDRRGEADRTAAGDEHLGVARQGAVHRTVLIAGCARPHTRSATRHMTSILRHWMSSASLIPTAEENPH